MGVTYVFFFFLHGDYAFLSNMFGISGARGTHFCLWCQATTSDLQIPVEHREEIPKRSLSSLKKNYNDFITFSKGNKTKAALHFNVINEPLWDIKPSHVCPPYLHMLLGIVKKHSDLLEAECNILDVKIAHILAASDYETGDEVYDKFIETLRKSKQELRNYKKLEREIVNNLERSQNSQNDSLS